jgi:anti-sigma B factor antagonist
VLGIIHREDEGISILELNGSLTFGQEDLEFRNDVERVLASGKIRLIFNLSGLHELDATGLGTILFARGSARNAGGNLAILNSNSSHIERLIEAQMETTFEVFKSERDAVASFFPDRDVHPYDVLEFVESMKLQHPKP